MSTFSIQALFLLYSAFSFAGAILITLLFWGKEDRSARLWAIGCIFTSIATAITVYRGTIPESISYNLMVSFEMLSILLFSDSLKNLSTQDKTLSVGRLTWSAPLGLFLLLEIQYYLANSSLTGMMTATSSLAFGIANLYCLNISRNIRKKFTSPLFLNFFSIIFAILSILYFLRVLNVLMGYSYYAFDMKNYNLFLWFSLIFFGSIRNLAYIVLRLQLGFTEHSRLNNMNLRLSNIIEERNEMILSLEKMNESASINALAFTIAHEINQPLASSKLNAQWIDLKLDSEPGNIAILRDLNTKVIAEIDRASTIVKNLSRISYNKQSSQARVNLSESIYEVTEISKNKLRKFKIDLNINCDPSFFIQINLGEWQQVLINLLNNSIEALISSQQNKKNVHISAFRSGENLLISFEDNGPGIPETLIHKIFNLHYTNKIDGSGIGLWLSKNIVDRHNGKISAKNIASGGICFRIEFPAA